MIFSTSEGYHDACGGYHWGCSIHRRDTMMHVDIMIDVGEYHEYIGVFNINQRLLSPR